MTNIEQIATIAATVMGAFGGLELFKWLYTRKSKRKEARAEADKAKAEADKAEAEAEKVAVEVENLEIKKDEDEFHFLRERVRYLDEELVNKDKRIIELVERVIEKTMEYGALSAHISALEAERKMKLCERRACDDRKPQSGY
jgi:uncharacterized coiled-coil DUF342 family protein